MALACSFRRFIFRSDFKSVRQSSFHMNGRVPKFHIPHSKGARFECLRGGTGTESIPLSPFLLTSVYRYCDGVFAQGWFACAKLGSCAA